LVNARHKFQTLEQGIHGFVSFEYADSTERLAATGFVQADKYKVAVDLDTGVVHIITDVSGDLATWSSIVGDGAGVNLAAGTQVALSGTVSFVNSNGISFGMSGSNQITASYIPGGAGSVNFSAGTTSNNLTAVTFSNSNGVSFGLNGSVITASIVPGVANINFSAGTTSNNLTAITFSNSNGLSFGLNGSTITGSYTVPTQTNQTVGLYATGNTTQNSSTSLDARSLSFNAIGAATIGYSNGSIQVSVPTQTAQTQSNVQGISAGTQVGRTGDIVFSNSNNITFGLSGSSRITASYNFNLSAGSTSNNLNAATFSDANGISFGLDAGTITASYTVPSTAGLISAINASAGTTSNNLSAIIFSNSNNVSFGLNGSTVTASISAPAQTNQTIGLFATGNTTQNSSTTLDARSLTFNGLGAASIGYSNGSVQVSVPTQTVQTQSNIQAIYDGANSISTGTIRYSNSNGISFGINGQTLTASHNGITSQTNQTVGVYGLGNTTQNSSTTLDARSLSFNGLGDITVGYSNGSIQISGSQTVQTQSLIQAIYDGANSISTGTIRFTNANGVSFSINGQTISGSVAAQTNQSVGLYALGNTTQNSSTTLDARSLSFNGLGAASVGYSNGSIQISVPNALTNINISAGTTSNNLTAFVFSNSNNVSFGLNGSTVTATVTTPAQTAQTVGLYAIGNTTQNSSTTLDARSLSFNGLGAATLGYSNGSVQVSVPLQTAQTQSNIQAIYDGANSISTGTIRYSNSNGISFGINGQTLTASHNGITSQTVQTVGLYALGNTTQNSSTILDARSLSFNGIGAATVGYSNGSIQISVPNALTNINVSAGTTSNNLTAFVFSNSNNVSFGLDGSTVTAIVPTQTNQTEGFYAVGNTAGQSSSTTFDARTLSVSGAGVISVGYSAGNLIISANAAGASINFSAGTTSNNLNAITFSNSNGLSFGLDGSTITGSYTVPTQTNQTVGLYGLGNTTQNSSTTLDARSLSFNGLGIITVGYSNGSVQVSATQSAQTAGLYALGNTTQNSSTTLDARSLSFNGIGIVSVGYSNGSIQVSATQSVQTQSVVVPSAGTQTATSGTVVYSNSNNITFGMSGSSRITASYNFNISAGTTSNNLNSVTFGNANGISFGLDASTITASYTVPTQTNQSVGLYALGNTTQNSSTTLDARSLSFNGLGAATVGYSNGSIQVSVPVQTAQTQSVIQAIYDGANSISTGTIRFTNANGVSFSINGQTISGSVAAQTNQTIGLYAVNNTTGQSSSSTFDARTLSFHGAGIASVGYSNGSVVVSVPAGGGGITNVNLSAGTTSNNLSAFVFSNSNNVSFGLNGSTVTATITVPAQTVQTVGLYAVSNTTGQSSSSTFDARTLSFNGAGNISVGYSGGSVVISGAGGGVANAAGTQTATSGTVVFSNSNGITFGMTNSSIITASFNGTLNSVVFSNSNNVIFGSAGNTTITASVNMPGAVYDGANSISTGTIRFSNANGVSFGIDGQTITASANGGGVVLSAGTNSTSTGTVVFSNSNNITFGMNDGGIVTASFNANNTASTFVLGISTQGNTKGTTGFANQSVQLVGTNGITLSQSINGNSATITIVGEGATVNKFMAFPPGQISSSQQTNSQISFRYIYLDNYISMTRLDVPMILTLVSTTRSNTANVVFTSGCVIYSLNGSTLNPIVGNTGSTTYSWASDSANYSNIIGLRAASFPLATLLTPGEYWIGLHISTTNNSSIGAATTQLDNSISVLCGSTYTALNYAEFGSTTGANTNGLVPMQGLCSISISNTTMTFQQSQISVSGVNGFRANFHVVFRNY